MQDELNKATQDRAAVEEEGKAVPGSCWARHTCSHAVICTVTNVPAPFLENRRQEHVQARAPQSRPRVCHGLHFIP